MIHASVFRNTVLRSTVVALLTGVVIASVPAGALTGSASAFIFFTTYGGANPDLTYNIRSTHTTTFTAFNAAEALAPVTHTGQLLQYGPFKSCGALGLVGHVRFYCSNRVLYSCPGVEGIWTGITRTTAFVPPLGKVFAAATGPLFANCPPGPGPCAVGIPSDVSKVISLDTGLPLDSTVSQGLPSIRLKRKDVDDHGEFMRSEWAIVEPVADGLVRVESASSAGYRQQLNAEPGPISRALAQSRAGLLAGAEPKLVEAPAGRYLVIQGSGHRYKLPMPLVKLSAPPRPLLKAADPVRVALRADFDHHGALQAVETLDGSDSLARELAGTLELSFVEGAEHRTALFAVFEVSAAGTKLISAVPVMPRCCCGEIICA